MKKNNLTNLTRNTLLLCLMAGLLMTATSCSNNNPTDPNNNGAPQISSVNPTKATIGSDVTIKGRNFSSVKNKNLVRFGQTKATVNTATETKLTVTVPKSLNPGGIYKLTVTVDGKTAKAPYKFKVAVPPETANAQFADGILETVTWNIEWFGYTNHGPGNESLQANNVIKVADTLNADLYAFEEVKDAQALKELASRMKGYKYIFGHTQNQGNGFIYNSNVIDSVSSGIIRKGKFLHPWAERKPFYFSFNYHPTKGNKAIKIYAVVIHAKAGAGQDDYQRRVTAAKKLYHYLTNKKPDARIILLGDFNDELTTSIYSGHPSPYKIFVDDKTHYAFPTLVLSQNDKTSEVNYQSVIDNIIISNEMEKYYKKGSAHAYIPVSNFIQNYGHTTSDHYPVKALFVMTR